MKNIAQLLAGGLAGFLAVSRAFAAFTSETPDEFATVADFDGDGRLDVALVDRSTGNIRLGCQAVEGALTWGLPVAGGIDGVTSVSAGRLLSATRDALAITAPSANRFTVIDLGLGGAMPSSRSFYTADAGPKLIAALPIGATNSVLDDYAVASVDAASATPATFVALKNTSPDLTRFYTGKSSESWSRLNPVVWRRNQRPILVLLADDSTNSLFASLLASSDTAAREGPRIASLPSGSDYASGFFAAGSPFSQIVFWRIGAPELRVSTFSQSPGGDPLLSAPVTFSLGDSIGGAWVLPGANSDRLAVVFNNGGAAAVFDFDGVNPPRELQRFTANEDAPFTTPVAIGLKDFVLMSGYGRSAQFRLLHFDGTRYVEIQRGNLPAVNSLVGRANLFLFALDPLAVSNARVEALLNSGDWTRTAGIQNGQLVSDVERFDGSTNGLRKITPPSMPPLPPGMGFVFPNQFAPDISLFSFGPPAGVAPLDVQISPSGGSYSAGLSISISAIPSASNIMVRLNQASWQAYLTPIALNRSTVLEAYAVRGSVKSPIRTASYSITPMPLRNPDEDPDGDGFSNRQEQFAGTDPNDPNSRPGGLPDTNGVIRASAVSASFLRWDDPASWIPSGAPDPHDTLIVSNAYFSVSRNVEHRGRILWHDSYLGPENGNVSASLTLVDGSEFRTGGGDNHRNYFGIPITNHGHFIFAGSYHQFMPKGTFVNETNGAVTWQASDRWQGISPPYPRFTNRGLFRTLGANNSVLNAYFEHHGMVDAGGGRLQFQTGDGDGEFQAGSGSVLEFSDFAVLDGSRFTGSGTNLLGAQGNINKITGSIASSNLVIGGKVTMVKSVLNGHVAWKDGYIDGGFVIATGATLIAIPGTQGLISGDCTNRGMIVWTSPQPISLFNNQRSIRFENEGLIDMQTDADIGGIATANFINRGIVRKSGGGARNAVYGQLQWVNEGRVENFYGGIVMSDVKGAGIFQAGAAAHTTLTYRNILGPGVRFIGAGTNDAIDLVLTGDTYSENLRIIQKLSAADASLHGQFFANGDATFSSSIYLAADGTLSLEGKGNWTFSGSVSNMGTVTLNGNGFVLMPDKTTSWHNEPGSIFEIRSVGAALRAQAGTFINRGTIRQSSGAATEFSIALVNLGLIDIQTGSFTVFSLANLLDNRNGIIALKLNSSADYGYLRFDGALNGVLQAVLETGFTPAVGTQFDIVRYFKPNGQFDTLQLDSRLGWQARYESSALTITAGAAATPEPPRLNVGLARANGQTSVRIAWIADNVDWLLEESSTIANPGGWRRVTEAIDLIGPQSVFQPVPSQSQHFYRLRWVRP